MTAPLANKRPRSSRFAFGVAASVLAVGAAAAACYNEVPGPQGPLPSPIREVSPQGPKPGPLVPTPHLAPELDAGMPVPTPQGISSADPSRITVPAGAPIDRAADRAAERAAERAADRARDPNADRTMARASSAKRVADGARTLADPPPPTQPSQPPANDAGVIDSASDLPSEVPDAGPIATPDAGQPLRR